MADAEAGMLAASGASQDYYDGYDYACAVNYEYVAAMPEFSGQAGLSQIGGNPAAIAALDFSAQLTRLNFSLLDSQRATLPHPLTRTNASRR